MSNFNVENDMQYLAEMSDDEKIIFLKVLTRLARADEKLDDNERDFIREIAVVYNVPANRFEEIINVNSDDEIVAEVKKIKNRKLALELIKEMCLLANADSDLSDNETLLIGRVGQAMGVELEKIQQISQWVIDRIIWLEEGKIIFEKF